MEQSWSNKKAVTLLPFGEAGVAQEAEGRRHAAVRQLKVVLDYLHKISRIGDLASIVAAKGRLDYEWYLVDTGFKADRWDPEAHVTNLRAKIGNYTLILSCSKSNFPGLQREGTEYIPTSTNKPLFDGDDLPLQGLVRLVSVDRKQKVLRGSALYLVLGTDLGRL